MDMFLAMFCGAQTGMNVVFGTNGDATDGFSLVLAGVTAALTAVYAIRAGKKS